MSSIVRRASSATAVPVVKETFFLLLSGIPQIRFFTQSSNKRGFFPLVDLALG